MFSFYCIVCISIRFFVKLPIGKGADMGRPKTILLYCIVSTQRMDVECTNAFPSHIPIQLSRIYAKHGVKYLFDWQKNCLSDEKFFTPNFASLIYSAPTSAGKTLIAEVIVACNILTNSNIIGNHPDQRKRALFLLPYISSAREKLVYLQSLWRPLNIVVKAFIGASSASIDGWSVAVCTIEKANTLINAMIESDSIHEIGTIVFDELHMLFDGERGAIVENLLAKLLFLRKEKGSNIQIIGMSATLGEHDLLSNWLGAQYLISHYRPLQLKEFLLMDEGQIFEIDGETRARKLEQKFIVKGDSKSLIGIAMEALMLNQSVLIFCPTKVEVEQSAVLLAKYIKYCIDKGDSNRFAELNSRFSKEKSAIIVEYFQQKTACTEVDLLHCIEFGVSYHHAGLTVEEREHIETLFRFGSIKLLVSTSTLSSGVNLPANRVIIRTNATSPIPLSYISYNQMIGRAGRQGQTNASFGESYLLCSRSDWPIVRKQIQRKSFFKPTRSLTRLLLEAINSSLVQSISQLKTLKECTISNFKKPFEEELSALIRLGLVHIGEDDEEQRYSPDNLDLTTDLTLRPTQLGRAVLASALDLHTALQVFEGLQNAMQSICLDSELHMLFLVTPINNLAINENAIDWSFYHQKWSRLSPELSRVAQRVGISENFFMQKLAGKVFSKDCPILNAHIRFFASLILFELINEKPITKVSRYWRINRGLLQALQQQAATYAYMIVSFCDRLGWIYLRTLLDGFAERLQFGVRRDLTELVRIPGIDAIRARTFHQHGIDSISALANSSTDKIRLILRKAVPYIGFNADVIQQKGKNTWLHGESHMSESKAAQMLVERAIAFLKEQMRSFSLPKTRIDLSLRFDSSCLNVTSDDIEGEIDDLTAIEQSWISEDLSESMTDLCETLSPLRLEVIESPKTEVDDNDESKENFHFGTPIQKRKQGLKKNWTNRISKVDENSSRHSLSSPLVKKPIFCSDTAPTNVELERNIEMVCSCWNMDAFHFLGVCGMEWADNSTVILASDQNHFYSFNLDSSKCSICFDSLSILLQILANPKMIKWLADAMDFFRKLRQYLTTQEIGARNVHCLLTFDSLLSTDPADANDGHDNKPDSIPLRTFSIQATMKKWSIEPPFWVSICFGQTGTRKLANSALNAFLLSYGGPRMDGGQSQNSKWQELRSIYMESLMAVAEMEFKGMYMDRRKATKMLEHLQEKMVTLEKEIFLLSKEHFSLESSTEVSKILFIKMKLALPEHIVVNRKSHKRRHFPTSSAVLKLIDHPICEKIIYWRQLGHSSKVLHGLLAALSAKNSRINAHFDNASTSSGRIICHSPNLQFIPKQTLLGKYSVRSLFSAAKGNVLIAADYSQIELRVLCELSGDRKLGEFLNCRDRDPFDEIAKSFETANGSSVTRGKAKQLCYAIIYGMGAENLSKELRLNTAEEAQQLINQFFQMFPSIKCWMESVVEMCKKEGMCETYFGRKKSFKCDLKDAKAIERRSVNFVIQGTASEIFRKAIVDIHQRLKEFSSGNAFLVLPIHDEVLVEVEEEMAKECALLVKQSMESVCPHFHFGLPVKISIGKDWGSLTPISHH